MNVVRWIQLFSFVFLLFHYLKIKRLLDEEGNKLDAAFLKLGTHPSAANKSLPQLTADVQVLILRFFILYNIYFLHICIAVRK